MRAILLLLALVLAPMAASAQPAVPPGSFFGGNGGTVSVSGSGSPIGPKQYQRDFEGYNPPPTRYWFTVSAPAAGTITDLYSSVNGASASNYTVTISICHQGTCTAVSGLSQLGVNNGEGGPTGASSDTAPLHTTPTGNNTYAAGDGIALDLSTVGGTFIDSHEMLRVIQ